MLGAAGGIGQPLSLLLKMSPLIDQLALYDIVNTPGMSLNTEISIKTGCLFVTMSNFNCYIWVGVAADLSHIESTAKVNC